MIVRSRCTFLPPPPFPLQRQLILSKRTWQSGSRLPPPFPASDPHMPLSAASPNGMTPSSFFQPFSAAYPGWEALAPNTVASLLVLRRHFMLCFLLLLLLYLFFIFKAKALTPFKVIKWLNHSLWTIKTHLQFMKEGNVLLHYFISKRTIILSFPINL